jgi:hyaluronan synthase
MAMALNQLEPKDVEMSRYGWTVRGLILAALGGILFLKVYMMLFIIDSFVGLYSIITGIVIFGFFFLTFVKFKDPYIKAKNSPLSDYQPLVSVVIPVKNEEGFIKDCVLSFLNSTYKNKEIIVVDDGSTDKTSEILDQMSKEVNIRVIHNPKGGGKKRAIEIGVEVAKGDIYFFTDSDSEIAPDAMEKAVTIFRSDHTIGAVTGHGRARGVSPKLNKLEKMQDVLFDNQFRIQKGAESSFSSISCCSGPVTVYRKEAVGPYIHAWVHDRFLGQEFKFATDRRLTAFVLSGRGSEVVEKQPIQNGVISAKSNSTFAWKMVYSPSIKVLIGPPSNFSAYVKQQIRWRKSFIRSIFSTGRTYWRRPFPIAALFYLQMGLKMLRPLIVFKSVVILPLMGDYITAILYFASVLFTSTIYAVDFRLRNPGSTQWIYRPIMTLFQMFVINWLLFYALITIRKTSWR